MSEELYFKKYMKYKQKIKLLMEQNKDLVAGASEVDSMFISLFNEDSTDSNAEVELDDEEVESGLDFTRKRLN